MAIPSTITVNSLGTNGIKITGAAGSQSGSVVGRAGDVDGDGIEDFLVLGNNGGSTNLYLIFGKVGLSSFTLSPSIAAADGFLITGEGTGQAFGLVATTAGDVNDDGYDDILVTAHANDSAHSNAGAAYILFGKASGFGPVTLNGSMAAGVGIKIVGDLAEDMLGYGAGTAGDFNNDNLTDIILGAPGNDAGGAGSGSAYILYGHTGGWSNIDLSTPPTYKRITGAAGEGVGFAAASAGDVNGDGADDVIMSATGSWTFQGDSTAPAGAVYVVFGSTGATGSSTASSIGFKITGDGTNKIFGSSVSTAGDFNGDGFDDVVIGANRYYGTAGAAYVVFGKGSGFSNITVGSGMAPSTGFMISGGGPNSMAGYSVSSAGDVNGDGYDDIIVGAPFVFFSGTSAAYVIYGRGTAGVANINLSSLSASDGFKIVSNAQYQGVGISVAGIGDVNGDGVDDLAVGAYQDPGSPAATPRPGAAYIIFGQSSNTAPTVNANTGLTLNEGASRTIAAAQLDFNDAQQADSAITYTITTAATNGTLYRNGVALSLNNTFTQADIAASLITYTHNGGETTSASFGFSVSDGLGGTVTGQTFAFTVNAVNDRPVNTVAGTQSIDEDTSRTFNTANGNLISVSDADSGTLTVTLSVDHGELTLSGTTGLSFGVGDGGADATMTFTGTQAAINAALDGLIYVPTADYNGTDTLTVTTNDIDSLDLDPGTSGGASNEEDSDSITINIADVNEPPVAVDDNGSTVAENATVAIDVVANDTDAEGDARSVTQIDGQTASVGVPITLASNATVTLNANGTLTYNPNGAFNYLVSASTGAANASATDSFSYTLNGGDTGAVSVAVTGVTVFGDRLQGDAGSNTITGTGAADLFMLGGGGTDNASGGAGDDGFYMGTQLSAGDSIDGGTNNGTFDQLGLQGNYNYTFSATNMVGIEILVLLSGSETNYGDPGGGANRYDYNLTTIDANVAAGQTLTINGNQLLSGEDVFFNGAAETNGSFRFNMSAGDDTLIGGAGNDVFYGMGGQDVMTGNGGNDVFVFQSVAHSPAGTPDAITDFTAGDKINLLLVDANAGAGGDQAFAFLGSGAFTNAAGQLRVSGSGTSWLVEMDVNGDGVADMAITVTTTVSGHGWSAADFVL